VISPGRTRETDHGAAVSTIAAATGVANAGGAVRPVLFHAHDGERAARDHDARIGSHIPPDRGVDRIAVRTLR
jgi:hypothetical protein